MDLILCFPIVTGRHINECNCFVPK